MASVGPGFVYGLTVLGTGDVVSNSTAGAGYGYQLIWALGLTMVFRYIWVNTSAKYVLVTGESLMAGYGRVGTWVPLLISLSFFPLRHFTNMYLILIMGNSAHLAVPLPTEWSAKIWGIFFMLIGFAMMFWGGYGVIESFCKGLTAVMALSLLIAALLSDPDPVAILQGAFIPSLPQAHGLYSAVLILMALIGNEAGSTSNLTYSYFIREREWNSVSYLKQQRFDLAVSVVGLFILGALLQIAAGRNDTSFGYSGPGHGGPEPDLLRDPGKSGIDCLRSRAVGGRLLQLYWAQQWLRDGPHRHLPILCAWSAKIRRKPNPDP